MLTVADVEARVAAIEAVRHDDEDAHLKEDELWADVLAEIAGRDGASAELAVAVLKTRAIKFCRWYA